MVEHAPLPCHLHVDSRGFRQIEMPQIGPLCLSGLMSCRAPGRLQYPLRSLLRRVHHPGASARDYREYCPKLRDQDDRVLLPSIVLAYLPQGGRLCGLTSQLAEEGGLYYPWESALGRRMDGQCVDLDRPRSQSMKMQYQIPISIIYYTGKSMIEIRGIREWNLSTNMKARRLKTGTLKMPRGFAGGPLKRRVFSKPPPKRWIMHLGSFAETLYI